MVNQVSPPERHDHVEPEPDGGRRGQILDAALHVMAEHGFRGASIKRIAQRAGLKSPALIYWYFRDKQALFEAVRHPQAAKFFADRGPLVVLGFLERYLRRQMELGTLRQTDPAAAARAFM